MHTRRAVIKQIIWNSVLRKPTAKVYTIQA